MSKTAVGQEEAKRRVIIKLTRELGPLVCGLLEDPSVIEIMLNPNGELWVERLGESMKPCGYMAESTARSLMNTIASTLNEELTEQKPILECELPLDGSRFEALVPPIVEGPTFTIRKKAIMVFTLHDYVEKGIMTTRQRVAIESAALDRKNILIVGGTGSGKTTLTNAVINYMVDVCPDDRFVIMEDTRELQCTAKNAVLMRSVDQADMTRLLKATMRLRPDRILVGEVRDGAALALLKAWNTGHPGGAATLHANSAAAGLIRMEQLVAEATHAPMQSLIGEAVDLIVSIERHAGSRRINEVLQVTGHDGQRYTTRLIGENNV
jgi:type IV secretion system protein VirB11